MFSLQSVPSDQRLQGPLKSPNPQSHFRDHRWRNLTFHTSLLAHAGRPGARWEQSGLLDQYLSKSLPHVDAAIYPLAPTSPKGNHFCRHPLRLLTAKSKAYRAPAQVSGGQQLHARFPWRTSWTRPKKGSCPVLAWLNISRLVGQ